MGEALNRRINIPLYALILSIAVIIGGFVINTKIMAATQSVIIDKQEIRIEKIEKEMLTAKDLHYIVIQLDDIKEMQSRFDEKLDKHINK